MQTAAALANVCGVGTPVGVDVGVLVEVPVAVAVAVADGDGVEHAPASSDTSSTEKLAVLVVGPMYSNVTLCEAPLANAFRLITRSV